jgi:hypothetical protein
MKNSLRLAVAVGCVSLLGALTAMAGTNDPGIQKREANQEKRIEQGVQSGQLTPHEAGKLEAQQAKIKSDEANLKADGKLTPRERAKLTREQNQASRNIHRKKHNHRHVS